MGTKSCGVSNPAEQHSKTNISPNSKKKSKIFQGVNSGTIWGRFMEKTRGQKSRATVPLKVPYCPAKTKEGRNWYQISGTGFALVLQRWTFFSNFKGSASWILQKVFYRR
jgi:hypothetical protein